MPDSLSIVADQQIAQAQEVFSRFGQVALVSGREINSETVRNSDVLLVRSVTAVDENLLKGSAISFVGSATSGIDHVDIEYLQSAGIQFAHAPGSNARSVAEYVLSSLLSLARKKGFSLANKTVGIVGCGQVGSRLQQLLQTLNVKCLVNDPPLAQIEPGQDWCELDALYEADIISFHVPYTDTGLYPTADMISADLLGCLKPDVILINTSRGSIVDEQDLIDFKQRCPDAELVLDVWRNEPDINLGLCQLAAIATAHIAGYSFEAKLKATLMLAKALGDYAQAGAIAETETGVHPDCPVLRFSESGDIVFQAVTGSYDVNVDAKALQAIHALPEAERGDYFDLLRKSYSLRHEFSSVGFVAEQINSSDINMLKALGFKPEPI